MNHLATMTRLARCIVTMDPGRCSIDDHAERSTRDVSAEHLLAAARLLAAAGDRSRLRILVVLRGGPADVISLASLLRRRSPYVSQHLAILRRANLVRATRRGRRVVYSLIDKHAEELVDAALAFVAARKG